MKKVQGLAQHGKFIAIMKEESARLAGSTDSEPGGNFTLVSNLFCQSDEVVRIYETFQPFRNEENLLTADGKMFIRILCNSKKEITVSCVNVAEKVESECGALSVALAVHLCSFSPETYNIYNNILDVRNTYLNCMKQNSNSRCIANH